MAGESIVEIKWDHPFSPPFPEEPVQEDPTYLGNVAIVGPVRRSGMPLITDAGSPRNHQAHYCYIPGVDLLAIHVMNFGLDEEGFWQDRVSCLGRSPSLD
jgi:hypothetical protein